MTKSYYGRGDPAERWYAFQATTHKLVGVDTETPSLQDRSLIGTGIAPSKEEAFFLTPDDPEYPVFTRILADPSVTKAYQNAPFDLRVLREYDPDSSNLHDTAILGRLARMGSAVLEDLSWWVSVQTERMSTLFERYNTKDVSKMPLEAVAEKCCRDAMATIALVPYLIERLQVPYEYYEREIRIAHHLDSISRQGILLDQERRGQLETHYAREVSYWKAICDGYGFNFASPQQVGYILGKRGNFLPLNKSRRGLATDADTLALVHDPLAKIILAGRRDQKILGTYLTPWRGETRAYTTLHLDAVTARISSTNAGKNQPDRNLQNIPRKVELKNSPVPHVRSMFIPDNGVFTRFDASQIELRTLAYISQDEHMLEILARDPKSDGGNLHRVTASDMGISYDFAKTFNFAMIYGADEFTLAPKIGVGDFLRVRELIDRWSQTFPGAARWMAQTQEDGLRDGFVRTLGGRPIPLPVDRGEKHAMNCSINYPIQGSAAEIFKQIMLALEEYLPITRLQIHDELLIDGRVKIPKELEHIAPFWTPLDVEYLTRWGVIEDAVED